MWFPICFLLLISINQISSANPPSSAITPSITNGLAQFTSRLFKKCAETTDGNVFISPFSVFNALEMVAQGAGGATYQQLYTVLGTGSNKQCTAVQFKNYYDSLDKAVGCATFSLANEIFVQIGCKLNQQYKKTLVNQFKSGIEQLNFADTAKSAQTINTFVSDKTNGKITELIEPDMLGADTRLVLVNAIYFKGDWLHKFDEQNTHQGQFTTASGSVPTNFMNVVNRFKIGNIDGLDATALELPYANSNLSFVIFLPNSDQSVDGLSQNLEAYTASDYSQVAQKMFLREVDVTIPKFKNEFSINLNQILSNLGLTDMFTDSADLTGMLDCTKQLKVSSVVHKAYIEVTEKGTEAAAATGVGVTTTAIEVPVDFLADHPFVYLIWETIQHSVLFIGRFQQPEQ